MQEAIIEPPTPHQIPDPPPTFKGREKELDELTEALRGGGATISGVRGMGGIGKTALAYELARRLAPDYPDAQILVDLDGTSQSPMRPEQAMGHVIHAFYPQADIRKNEGEVGGLYRSVLHDREALLLLDDAANAEQVEPLVPPSSCGLLVTSRRHFRLPGMYPLDLDVLDEEAALDLLRSIAPRIGEWAEEIAALCGYLPLALELAASALAERVDLTPAEYARRLRDQRARFDLVDASLSLSYNLLSEELQRLWTRLSVFSIPFTRHAAAAVWEMAEDPSHDQLGELLRYSLVDWKEEIGRYQLHDLARVFAYTKLQERRDPHPIHQLAAGYLGAKLTDEERGGTPEEALEVVDQWERAEAWKRFAQSASALVGSLDRLGYWTEIQERLERARTAVEEHLAEPSLQATLLSDLGIMAYKRAEWDRAIEMHRCSLEIFERLGDAGGIAKTWGNLGNVYRQKNEWDRAIEMYQQSLETFERLGDSDGVARTWGNLGSVYRQKGNWDLAIEMHQQSLEIKESLGNIDGMAQTFNNLGLVYADKGEWDLAIEYYKKDLEISQRLGDAHGMAQTRGNLGSVYLKQGEWDRAAETFQEILGIFECLDDIHSIAKICGNLGSVYLKHGEWNRAIEMYQRSLHTKERLGDTYGMAQTFNNLGLAYEGKGEWGRAIEYYQKDLAISHRLGDGHGMAQIFNNLGLVYERKGERDQAIEMYQKSLETKDRLGDVHGVAKTRGNLARVCADRGGWNRAIEMYQESLDTFERLGDAHGTALTRANMGQLYLKMGREEEAKPLLARAYLVFTQLGSAYTRKAAHTLIRACGSTDAVKAYLAQVQEEVAGQDESPSDEEGGSPAPP